MATSYLSLCSTTLSARYPLYVSYAAACHETALYPRHQGIACPVCATHAIVALCDLCRRLCAQHSLQMRCFRKIVVREARTSGNARSHAINRTWHSVARAQVRDRREPATAIREARRSHHMRSCAKLPFPHQGLELHSKTGQAWSSHFTGDFKCIQGLRSHLVLTILNAHVDHHLKIVAIGPPSRMRILL